MMSPKRCLMAAVLACTLSCSDTGGDLAPSSTVGDLGVILGADMGVADLVVGPPLEGEFTGVFDAKLDDAVEVTQGSEATLFLLHDPPEFRGHLKFLADGRSQPATVVWPLSGRDLRWTFAAARCSESCEGIEGQEVSLRGAYDGETIVFPAAPPFFHGLVMRPHDGFKPLPSPAPPGEPLYRGVVELVRGDRVRSLSLAITFASTPDLEVDLRGVQEVTIMDATYIEGSYRSDIARQRFKLAFRYEGETLTMLGELDGSEMRGAVASSVPEASYSWADIALESWAGTAGAGRY